MNFWQRIRQSLPELRGKLTVAHWTTLGLLGLLVIGCAGAALWWSGSTEYEILCAGLKAEECSELTSSLREAGIDVRVVQAGTAVMVPSNRVNQARMVAAEQGLPSAGSQGFAAFKNPKIGITPFAERINYLNALQNELAATISSLEAVRQCRVHLALPQKTAFRNKDTEPSASVFVALKGNRSLNAANVAGITNLVASAVQELDPEEVTLTDSRGRVLNGKGDNGVGVVAADQWDYRRTMEKDLADKAERMLTRVLGPGHCDVRVNAELEFQDSRETTREYDPDKKVIVSETIEKEESTGAGATVGGPVGTTQGASGGQNTGEKGANSGSSETQKTETEYQVSESVQEVIRKGANIKRLSVAAFVDLPDDNQASTGADGENPDVPGLQEIRDIVKDAVGFDEQRGDSLQVLESTFASGAPALARTSEGIPSWAVPTAKYSALAVLGLVLLFIARRILNGLQAEPRFEATAELIGLDEFGETPEGKTRDEVIRERVSRFIEERPEDASRLLEGWIEGGEDV